MDESSATKALAALAQPHRLRAFRLLVQRGPAGLAAGEIARQLAIPHNTLSTHLGLLAGAGLLASRREGRSVIYAVDFDGLRALLAFLVQDCCQGSPAVCGPLIDIVMAGCAAATPAAEEDLA